MPQSLGDEKEKKIQKMEQNHFVLSLDLPKKQSTSYVWITLGQGSYNKVWKSNFSSPQALVPGESHTGPWVLKYPIKNPSHSFFNLMNNKNRAVRVWNEVNADQPKAGLYREGWVAAFIENARQATDDEICKKIIEIFCATGRIVLDAAIPGNVLTVEHSEQNKETILVDMDLAIKRSDSPVSIAYVENSNIEAHFSENMQKYHPTVVEITKNLLYFEDNLKPHLKTLCCEKQVTQKNIQDLSWLRINHKKLTLNLFQDIAVINQSDGIISDVILEVLSSSDKTDSLDLSSELHLAKPKRSF